MCSTRLWRLRAFIIVAITLTLLRMASPQSISGQLPQDQTAGSQQEALCRTGQDLALAIANPLVEVAVLLEDVTLTDRDFSDTQQQGLVPLQRNFTVRGSKNDRPTVLDFNYLRSKVVLIGRLCLLFRNLFLVNCRRGSATQQPGFDFLTAAPDPNGQAAIVQMQDCFIVYRFCFPPYIAIKAFENLTRPYEIPGKTEYTLPYPSPYTCPNSSTGIAVPMARNATSLTDANAAGSSKPLSDYPCVKLVILYADVAVYGGDMNDDGSPAYNSSKYAVYAQNTLALCTDVLQNECILRYGPFGCLTYTIKPFLSPPPANTRGTAAAISGRPDADHAPSDPHRRRSTIILASTIGGAALLAVAVAVTVAVFVARQRRFGAPSAGEPAAARPIDATCISVSSKVSAESPEDCRRGSTSNEFFRSNDIYVASGGSALDLCTALPEKSQLKVPVIAAAADATAAATTADGPGADDMSHSAVHAGSAGGDLCFGSVCTASAEGFDVALLPVTALTPLHPGIDLDVRLDFDGGGSSRGGLQLSSVTLGKGAFGRVLAGTYGGLRVAVKIIDQGLMSQWPGVPLTLPPPAASGNSATEDGRGVAVNNKVDDHPQEGGGAAGSPVVIGQGIGANADAGVTRGPRTLMHVVDAAAPSSSPGNAKSEDLISPHFRSSAGAAIVGGGEADEVPRDCLPSGRSCRCPLGIPAGEVSSHRVVARLRTTAQCRPAEGNDTGAESYHPGQVRCCRAGGVGSSVEVSGVPDPTNNSAGAGAGVGAAGTSATAAVALCGALVPPVGDTVADAGATMLPLPPALPVAAVAAGLAVVKCTPALGAASNPAVSASVTSHTQFSAFFNRDPEIAGGGSGGGGRTSTKPKDSQAALLPAPEQNSSRSVGSPAAVATMGPAAAAVEAQARPPARPAVTKRELTLKQEVEVLARCQHPNVVRLLAACLRPPRFCLVMELMETSLDRLLYNPERHHKLLPLDTVLHIAIQIAKGLAYLHPTIVHRDLKPGNVLISHSDAPGRFTVKLADFGLSRLRDTVLVTEHPEVGTAPYIAPEAFDVFNNRITDRVDVYALGIILWEMLAGRPPWSGLNIVVIALSVAMYRQRPPLVAVPRDRCPRKLRLLIESCWEHIPERRPAAAEVVKRLALIQQQFHLSCTTVGSDATTASAAVVRQKNSPYCHLVAAPPPPPPPQ
ncbi:hypothetical protein VaNZ11_009853 [Volvox africanus]|uniref:Protein kinase domain-containing protein n=1 Tax=Volvox africanus TaxID=51714 RepID=A0ABQ5S9M2_9CHLO|nr:hypothetical protein VaNZ11_009853 [Volvox africanus]